MTHGLLHSGGPHSISRTGPDQYSMEVELPTDAVGMTGRECLDAACMPGSFKVRSGTGVTTDHQTAFCPYCRKAADPEDFATRDQLRYAQEVATGEVAAGVQRMASNALGLDSNGKRRIGGGLLSIEMSMNSNCRLPVRRPREEQLRRDVVCPNCTLAHAVYGLAVWCPDCGEDIFVTHVETESEVLRAMLNDVERRNTELGPRAAARDIENGLEDVVSVLEAALKAMTHRRLLIEGQPRQDVEKVMAREVRNRFQGYDGAAEILNKLFNFDLTTALDTSAVDQFKRTLEKRHAITHNLGIVDRKYLQKVRTNEAEGRDVNLDEQEVLEALRMALILVRHSHGGLFP